MLKLINISELPQLSESYILLDARSEGEFEQGHIPNAISFPILNNEERKLVGTCYKVKGHRKAVVLGYELVGSKFKDFVSFAYKEFKTEDIYIHCWRGGLRSQILGNLLSSAGFRVHLIKGGYKTYRAQVLEFLNRDFYFEVLGGLTGSGKTEILASLSEQNHQVIDFEKIANHRGSAFGYLGQDKQPTQEQFENNLFEKVRHFDFNKIIWVEDESRLIGQLQIPSKMHEAIRNGFVHFLDYSFQQRLERILSEYGRFDPNVLVDITSKLKKRMGDLNNRNAINSLLQGYTENWAMEVLKHYDKQYLYGFGQREPSKHRKIELQNEELFAYLTQIKKSSFS